MTLKVEMRMKHQPVCCGRSSAVGLHRARISLGLPKACFALRSWTPAAKGCCLKYLLCAGHGPCAAEEVLGSGWMR